MPNTRYVAVKRECSASSRSVASIQPALRHADVTSCRQTPVTRNDSWSPCDRQSILGEGEFRICDSSRHAVFITPTIDTSGRRSGEVSSRLDDACAAASANARPRRSRTVGRVRRRRDRRRGRRDEHPRRHARLEVAASTIRVPPRTPDGPWSRRVGESAQRRCNACHAHIHASQPQQRPTDGVFA